MKNARKSRNVVRRFFRHRAAAVCLAVLAVLILMALFAQAIAPYSPTKPSGKFSQPPTPEHILGTDKIGRDMYSRLLFTQMDNINDRPDADTDLCFVMHAWNVCQDQYGSNRFKG